MARERLADPVGTHERIYAAVRAIPRGKVATYGQVADLAGLPGQARLVGYALHALPDGSDVPWQRVLNARGEVSPRVIPGADGHQRAVLEREGVAFDAKGRVDLERCRWEGPTGPRRPRRASPPSRSSRAPRPRR